jgi:flagellin-like hook-associated protein FlgL
MSDIVLSAGVRQNLLSLQKTADLSALTQNRLATGKKVNSALDNPTNFFTSQALQNRAGDLSALLDSIGQAQKTIEAADQGLTALAKLVQSAKSIALQARQSAEPQTTYSLAQATGNVAFAQTIGTFTSGTNYANVVAAGNVDIDVTIGGVTTTVSAAIGANATGQQAQDAIRAAIAASPVAGRVNLDFNTTTANRFTISAADSDVDLVVKANTTTANLFLTTGAATPANDTTVASQNMLDLSVGLNGKALTVQANGGTAKTINFGYGAGQVSTVAELQAALAGTNVTATIGAGNFLSLSAPATTGTQNSLVISGTAAGLGAGFIGIVPATTNGLATPPATDPTRANLQTQYNNLLSQIDALAKDASYNGINLLYGDNLKVVFNEKGTSSLTITGVKFDITGLGLSLLGAGQFQSNTAIDTAMGTVDAALAQLRTQGANYGSTLSTVQTRQDFTRNLITTLQTGADALVLADTNEEGANMLALQTRQQLSTTALSLANQAAQAVLRLFG